MAPHLNKRGSNQHIFDSFVQTVLDSYEVPLIYQSTGGDLRVERETA